MKKQIKNLMNKAKYPIIYAGSFSALTGITEGVKSAVDQGIVQGLETMVKTGANNLPFFTLVNIGYAKAVDLTTKKYGRVGANVLCLAVNAGFGLYAYLTGDNNPTYQIATTTAVGLYLTNKQTKDIQLKLI
ncbi:MAG: hypothetical protein ACP5OG_02525 [Candidatus Nanoarchaeia archaeon]